MAQVISGSAQFDVKYATYEGLAAGGGMMTWQRGEAFEMSAGSRFSLTIEGDLNARERADIGKALKTIDKIMQDLVDGDFDKIIKRAMKLGRLDTLQSLSADIHYQKEVYYQHQETEMIATRADAVDRAPEIIPEPVMPEEMPAAGTFGIELTYTVFPQCK